MKVKIQGELKLTYEQFNELSLMMDARLDGMKVTYMGVVVDKMWLTKKEKKKLT